MNTKLRQQASPSIVPEQIKAPGLSEAELTLAVRRDQAHAMLVAAQGNLLKSLPACFLVGFILSRTVALETLVIWLLCSCLVVVARLAVAFHELRSGFWQRHPETSLRRNIVGATIFGTVVGSIGLSLESPALFIEHGLAMGIFGYLATLAIPGSIPFARNAQAYGIGLVSVSMGKLLYLGTTETYFVFGIAILILIYGYFASEKATRIYVEGVKARVQAEAFAKELATANRDLKFQATHDSLTGLLNRGAFHNEMAVAVYSLDGVGRELILILIDLDGFKTVNDTLGHGAGDELLRQVAQRLKSIVDVNTAKIARLGGDEFALIVPFESMNQLDTICSLIISRLSRPYSVHGATVTIGASAGVQRFRRGCQNPDVLLHHADTALYQAKNSGRGKWIMSQAPDHSEGGKLLHEPRFRQRARL